MCTKRNRITVQYTRRAVLNEEWSNAVQMPHRPLSLPTVFLPLLLLVAPPFSLSSRWRARGGFFTPINQRLSFPPRNLINPIIGFFRSWLLRAVQRFPRLGSNQITTSPVCCSHSCLFVSPTFFFLPPSPILFCLCPIIVCSPFSISSLDKSPLRMRLWSHFSSHSRVIINTLYTQASNHIAGSLCILLSSPDLVVYCAWSLFIFDILPFTSTIALFCPLLCPLCLLFLCLCFSLSFRGSTRAPANPGRLTSRPPIEPQCASLRRLLFLPPTLCYDLLPDRTISLLEVRIFSVWLSFYHICDLPDRVGLDYPQVIHCFVCVRPWLRPANATVI